MFARLTDCFSLWKGSFNLHTQFTYHYQRHILFNFISIPRKIVVTWLQAEEHSSKVSIGQTVFDVDGRQEELFSWLESLINSSMKRVAVIMAYFWQSICLCYGKFANIATNKKLAKISYITWWQDNMVIAIVNSFFESEIGFFFRPISISGVLELFDNDLSEKTRSVWRERL